MKRSASATKANAVAPGAGVEKLAGGFDFTANGMCFDTRGHLIACADVKNALWSIAPDGKVTVIVREYGGKLLNGPNDVWVRPDGALYFTDPFCVRTVCRLLGFGTASRNIGASLATTGASAAKPEALVTVTLADSAAGPGFRSA